MQTIINNIGIESVTAWLPEDRLDMRSLGSLYGNAEVENIIKATGVESVRIAEETMTSSDMCYKAAEHLFDMDGIDRSSIDGLILVSQTSDYILPATSICLQDRLGFSENTVCMDIHYGCSGYVYGLFQAACWIHSGMCSRVLVLAGDTTSRMINPMDKSLRMVFGDCGTATLVGRGDHSMGFHIQSDGSGADRLIVPAGGFRTPVSAETSLLEYDEEHNGRTQNDLFMDGMAIFNFAITKVHNNVNSLLEAMHWEKDSVGLFALHQANVFMVNYVRKKLKARPEVIPTNVTNYGNTGPATIPLLFSDLCGEGKYDLSKVVMSGFGVGLSWGSVAANMCYTRFYNPVNK